MIFTKKCLFLAKMFLFLPFKKIRNNVFLKKNVFKNISTTLENAFKKCFTLFFKNPKTMFPNKKCFQKFFYHIGISFKVNILKILISSLNFWVPLKKITHFKNLFSKNKNLFSFAIFLFKRD